MSHVSTTAHYNLPIYGGSDIINPLTDVNGTNEALDTAIYEVAQELASGVTDITDVKNKVGDASLDTASQNLSGAVNELKSAIDTQAGDITDVEANVGTLQSQMATTTGNITTLNTTVAGLQTEVSGKASQTAVNTLATKVGTDALITTADDLSGAVNELKNEIDELASEPSVVVTGNGTKTLRTLLNEMFALIDRSKITPKCYMVEKRTAIGETRTIHNFVILPTYIQGDYSYIYGENFYLAQFQMEASNSTAKTASVQGGVVTIVDASTQVVAAGDTFEFYYK